MYCHAKIAFPSLDRQLNIFSFLFRKGALYSFAVQFVRPQTEKIPRPRSRILTYVLQPQQPACHFCNGLISQPKCDCSLLTAHLTGAILRKRLRNTQITDPPPNDGSRFLSIKHLTAVRCVIDWNPAVNNVAAFPLIV